MLLEIGMDWLGDYCALCKTYYISELEDIQTEDKSPCWKCPLHENDYGCNRSDSPWRRLSESKQWRCFVQRENQMILIMEEMRNKIALEIQKKKETPQPTPYRKTSEEHHAVAEALSSLCNKDYIEEGSYRIGEYLYLLTWESEGEMVVDVHLHTPGNHVYTFRFSMVD